MYSQIDIKTSIFYIIKNLTKHFDKKNNTLLSIFILSSLFCGFFEMTNLYLFSLILKLLSSSNSDGVLSEVRFLELLNYFKKYANLNYENFYLIGTIFIIFTFFTAILKLYNLKIRYELTASIGSQLSSKAFWLTINQPYISFSNKNSSEATAVLTKYIVETIGALIGLATLSSSIIIIISILTTLILINFKLSIPIFIVFIIIYFLTYSGQKKKFLFNSSLIKEYTNLQIKNIQETHGFIKDIILNNLQRNEYKKYYEIDKRMRKAESNSYFLINAPKVFIENIGLALICFLVLVLTIIGMPKSSLIILMGTLALGIQKLLPAINLVYSSLAAIKSNTYYLIKVIEYLDQQNNYINPVLEVKNKFKFIESIRIKNLSFSYSSNQNETILNQINFNIKSGDNIGIVGSTGSGKSTLINIILTLIQPQHGKLLVNGLDINSNYTYIKKWRNSISHVPQFIYLSDSTIEENIAFQNSKEINYLLLKEVCKLCLLDEFIESLPQKYKTIVGERGAKLSGGQLQRIGIARALYKKSSVLILDEATSALDIKTESRIIKNIESINSKKILITIAHRLEALKNCDYWIYINSGNLNIINKFEQLSLIMK